MFRSPNNAVFSHLLPYRTWQHFFLNSLSVHFMFDFWENQYYYARRTMYMPCRSAFSTRIDLKCGCRFSGRLSLWYIYSAEIKIFLAEAGQWTSVCRWTRYGLDKDGFCWLLANSRLYLRANKNFRQIQLVSRMRNFRIHIQERNKMSKKQTKTDRFSAWGKQS